MKYTLKQVKDSALWKDVLSRTGGLNKENHEFLLFLLFRAVNVALDLKHQFGSERGKNRLEKPLMRSFLWDSTPEDEYFWREIHAGRIRNLKGGEWVSLIQR